MDSKRTLASDWSSVTGSASGRLRRRAIEPLGLVAEQLGCLTPVVKVELPFGVLGHFLIHPQNLTLDHFFERGLLFGVKQCDVGHGRAWLGSSFAFT